MVPGLEVFASPLLPALLIVATECVPEPHVATVVKSWVEASERYR